VEFIWLDRVDDAMNGALEAAPTSPELERIEKTGAQPRDAAA
jgi:hypothetical protein